MITKALSRHFSARIPLIVLTTILGVSAAALSPHLRAATSEEFQVSLAQAMCEEVSSDNSGIDCSTAESSWIQNINWQPSRGALRDYVWGRPLFCSFSLGNDQAHDVYRVILRVTPDGSLIKLKSLYNLTATPLANEVSLHVGKEYLAFSTENASDSQAILSLLRLGDPEEPSSSESFLQTLNISLHRFLTFGDISDIIRADLFIPSSFRTLQLDETIDGLWLQVDASRFKLDELFQPGKQIDSVDEYLAPDSGREKAQAKRLTAQVQRPGVLPWFDLAADLGRKYLGKYFIAWLEGRTFALGDRFLTLVESNATPIRREATYQPSYQKTKETIFPPEPVQSLWQAQEKTREGQWQPSGAPLLVPPIGEKPLFYQTVIRPDPERSGSVLHLVAMDMSRLQLGMRAGYEDPHPITGPPGSGHLPLEAEIHQNIVATFNGAFKTTHGQFGMKAEGRLLVPPQLGAATVFIDAAGNSQIGSYQSTDSVSELKAFRQNLELLIDGDRLLPSGRKNWGEHLYGAGIASPRSGLCGRADGTLIYAYSNRTTAKSLARGMQLAGCTAGIHLDMNPGHCAFIFQNVESVNPLIAEGQPLTASMKVNPNRYIKWSPKDFFYLSRRQQLKTFGSLALHPLDAQQPKPLSVPGLFIGQKTIANLPFRVIALDANRFQFIAESGAQEGNFPLQKLSTQAEEKALLRFGLGHRTFGRKPGLIIGENRLIAPNRRDANLLIDHNGRLSILPPGRETQVDEHLVQLSVLARDGVMNAAARALGGFKVRSALCLLDEGLLIYAEIASDTIAPLVHFMTQSGCALVVSADRGSQSTPNIQFKREDDWESVNPLTEAAQMTEGVTRIWALESQLPSTFSVRKSRADGFELGD